MIKIRSAKRRVNQGILERFWRNGIKVNSYGTRKGETMLQITFADLRGKGNQEKRRSD